MFDEFFILYNRKFLFLFPRHDYEVCTQRCSLLSDDFTRFNKNDQKCRISNIEYCILHLSQMVQWNEVDWHSTFVQYH